MPTDRDRIERILVDAYGAADPVQLDGVGGATPTTSKAAVVGASAREGVDIDYLFAQVGIGTGTVEWGSNCGNCATAIALYAVAEGLVPLKGDRTPVVMRNINTGAVLEAEVDTPGGRVQEFGDRTVPGTLAGGVPVGLAFRDPAGATTGHLLPTGLPAQELPVGELAGGVRIPNSGAPLIVSMVDAGAPVVLVDAVRAGRTGAETLDQMRAEASWLRATRHATAVHMGLVQPRAEPGDAVPKTGLIGPPVAYTTTLGEHVAAHEYDVSARMLSMNSPTQPSASPPRSPWPRPTLSRAPWWPTPPPHPAAASCALAPRRVSWPSSPREPGPSGSPSPGPHASCARPASSYVTWPSRQPPDPAAPGEPHTADPAVSLRDCSSPCLSCFPIWHASADLAPAQLPLPQDKEDNDVS